MGSAATESGAIAKRYAVSLLEMAEKGNKLESVERDLNDLWAMLQSSADLQSMIKNPLFTREQQTRAVLALADNAKFTDITTNFLGVLVANRRIFFLEGILKAFQKALHEHRGEVEAEIVTAFALTPAQTDKLQKELSKKLGSNVTLNVKVNKDILGGLIVTVGSCMIDNSVRRKLAMLKNAMNANEKVA